MLHNGHKGAGNLFSPYVYSSEKEYNSFKEERWLGVQGTPQMAPSGDWDRASEIPVWGKESRSPRAVGLDKERSDSRAMGLGKETEVAVEIDHFENRGGGGL